MSSDLKPIQTAAIVVTLNRADLLRANLSSLKNQSLPFTRIIVVDNGSNDGTCEWVRKTPGIDLVELPGNKGFAGGVNAGIRVALEDDSIKCLALINNDLTLAEDWHLKAARALFSCSEFGSCATCLLKKDQPAIIDTAGIYWKSPGLADNRLSGHPMDDLDSFYSEIFGPCAAAALYRKEFFEEVGLFDERLFAYQEDVDLALRGQLYGWKCVFTAEAQGVHSGFGTNRKFPLGGTYADYYNARNRIYVLAKSLPGGQWKLHWKLILKRELLTCFRSIPEGRAGAVLTGILHGLARLPKALRARKRIFSVLQKKAVMRRWEGAAG